MSLQTFCHVLRTPDDLAYKPHDVTSGTFYSFISAIVLTVSLCLLACWRVRQ